VEAPGGRHGHRRTVVPLELASGVHVDVGLATDHGHGLGPCGTHLNEDPTECLSYSQCFGRWTGAAHHDPEGRGDRHRVGPFH